MSGSNLLLQSFSAQLLAAAHRSSPGLDPKAIRSAWDGGASWQRLDALSRIGMGKTLRSGNSAGAARQIARDWFGPKGTTPSRGGNYPFGQATTLFSYGIPSWGAYTVDRGCTCPPENPDCDWAEYVNEALRLILNNTDVLGSQADLFVDCVVERLIADGGIKVRVVPLDTILDEWGIPESDRRRFKGIFDAIQAVAPRGPDGPLTLRCGSGSELYHLAMYDGMGVDHYSESYAHQLGQLAESIVHELFHSCGAAHNTGEDLTYTSGLGEEFKQRAECACNQGDPTNQMTSACVTGDGTLGTVACVPQGGTSCLCTFTCHGGSYGGGAYPYDDCEGR